MKLLINGTVVQAVLRRRGGRVRLSVAGDELGPADVTNGVRLREATAEEWEELRAAGYAALWRRPAARGVNTNEETHRAAPAAQGRVSPEETP